MTTIAVKLHKNVGIVAYKCHQRMGSSFHFHSFVDAHRHDNNNRLCSTRYSRCTSVLVRCFNTSNNHNQNQNPDKDHATNNAKDTGTTNANANADKDKLGQGKRILDIGSTLNYANQGYHDLERALMQRINESNQKRFRVVLLSSILFFVWVIAVFGDKLKKMLTDQTADLAKETLTNEVSYDT